ncbi:MAG: glycosyltransferase family 2 protein [Bacteroidetes bacterium]|jgi:glycosyltransferase involved in cell wall biosynthesis|nr:glycosyltransferase family 2 protein [Bacteroidota bacterium]
MPAVHISAVIITYNEARNIGRCLESLQGLADEIVVVDSFSADGTPQLAAKMGARVVQHPFDGHIEQKNRAMHLARHHVVLSLDADEALSPQLKASILEVKNDWKGPAYGFNRLTNYCGKWVRHCGWYPDKKVRLWDKRLGHWGGYNPHDRVELLTGLEANWLAGDLAHYSYYSVDEHLARSLKYAKIKARAVYSQGRKSSPWKQFLSPPFKFIWAYVVRLGFLDGRMGLTICLIQARESWFTYLYLGKLQRGEPI